MKENTVQLDLESVNQTLELLKGKWKVSIIGCLSLHGKLRFSEIAKQVNGIGAKMLSKELKTLEQNELVKRTVLASTPVTIEYELTRYGETLDSILLEMSKWGSIHRNRATGSNPNSEIKHYLTFDI